MEDENEQLGQVYIPHRFLNLDSLIIRCSLPSQSGFKCILSIGNVSAITSS